jgi:hypothetical protein
VTKINNEEHIITPEKGETALETKEKPTSRTKAKIMFYYKCSKDGHLSPNCPNLNKQDKSEENEEQSMSKNQILIQ